MARLGGEFGSRFGFGQTSEGPYVQAGGVVFHSQDVSGRTHSDLERDIRLHGKVSNSVEDRGTLSRSDTLVKVFSAGEDASSIPALERTLVTVREHTPPNVPVLGVLHTPNHIILKYR